MDKSERFWDKTAIHFDQEERKDEQTYNKMIEKTRKYLQGNNIVLDYGCGTGRISNEIAGDVKAIQAVDISSKMIEIAKRKADGRNIENIAYAHSTIFDERFGRGSFDVILAFYILHLVEDTQKVVQRTNELLKPGGWMISTTPCMAEKTFLHLLAAIMSKTGFVPSLRSFRFLELEHSIADGNFEIVETECLHPDSGQYFIAARKV